MIWLLFAAIIISVSFAGVLIFGAPYLPTLTPQVHIALELADVKPGQTLLELGCGDGKVLIAAAQIGVRSIGYELNPFLALIAWLRTRRFGKNVKIICGNFWTKEWPEADIIFVFLLNRYMSKLDKNIIQYKHKPIKLVSFAFQVPNRDPDATKGGMYLYEYTNA